MSQQWFIRRGNQEKGPLTPRQMKQLVNAGKLVATDYVRTSNQETWRPAVSVKGLFEATPPAIPAPATSAMDFGTVVVARIPRFKGLLQPIRIAVDGEPKGEIGGQFPTAILDLVFGTRRTLTVSLPAGDYTLEVAGGGLTRRDIWHVTPSVQQNWSTYFIKLDDPAGGINLVEDGRPADDSRVASPRSSDIASPISPEAIPARLDQPAKPSFYKSADFWTSALEVVAAVSYVIGKALVYATTPNGGRCSRCEGTRYCYCCRGQRCFDCSYTGECQHCLGTGRGHH